MITKALTKSKKIALVAHDNKKAEMLAWAEKHKEKLQGHILYATGTTGKLLEETLNVTVEKLKSGPLGGDQQIGAMICEEKIEMMFFFWDPLEAQPHEPDVKALLRIGVLYNIPVASNTSSADFLITSPYFNEKDYDRQIMEFGDYVNRSIPK
ncbi:methylglyoxal synthase [Aureibacter tunicatorum]|uniref:Methylglyoxal synthase n=1 Tax=Aureibacter tunicatorum TaxID=866807 RepID=A0AAE3XKN6_9BACT|nr:methylglyoxal synthase [Aureibacter tunicatorum]MDR6237496.1 methylglyoxal synthase [Aureibacter tunicatorum]BDD02530.1 methylglyoxal synthase [Aureibacter tunicatorum]